MITQGFPLWAVESDGRTYAVVGWDEYQYPFLLLVGAPGAAARNPIEHETFTYTTTDPRDRDKQDTTTEPDSDLRQRLTALADRFEHGFTQVWGENAARQIRDELAK